MAIERLVDYDGTFDKLPMIACFFHWFGVSICNYARLVEIKTKHFAASLVDSLVQQSSVLPHFLEFG